MEKTLKKALFIDRDGTIIIEPTVDCQVDSMDKFRFLPGAITSLASIAALDYRLVMATNQDGLGTESFPEGDFWPVQNKMLEILGGEGIHFADILIDRTLPHQNAITRKPGTGMFGDYVGGDYDLASSFVIGDRITDIRLAANLGARGILMQPRDRGLEMVREAGLEDICTLITESWAEISEFLRKYERSATVRRNTRETQISVAIDIDGRGASRISTGIGFLDHMLDQIVHHGGMALQIDCKGDLHVDEHHTVEDVAIALGEAIHAALGPKRGIERYGFALPMDDAAALVLLDFGGRSELVWDVNFASERIGEISTQMFRHFFKSLSLAARCNLQISTKGENDHHRVEAIFKAFARALKAAVRRDVFSYDLPSSKGIL